MKNVVILAGRLGQDPEIRYTTNGTAVATFSLATSERWRNKSGEKQERTDWHRVVVFGNQAERVGEFLRKGRLVLVEGKIQTRAYTDKENVKRKITEIKASSITFLPDGMGKGEGKTATPTVPEAEVEDSNVGEQDIPF